MVSFGNTAYKREELPDDEFSPIPAGEYTVTLESAEQDIYKELNVPYIKIKAQVVDGDYKGRILFDYWYGLIPGTSGAFSSIGGGKVDTEKLSAIRMGSLMDAVGLQMLNDTNEFVGKVVGAKVTVSKDGKWNNIQKYLPLQQAGTTNQQAGNTATQQQQPANQGGGAPWAKK